MPNPCKYLHATFSVATLCAVALNAHAQTATPAPAAGPSTAPEGTVTKPKAPAAVPAPYKIGSYSVTGSIRGRYESWDYFDTPGFDNAYSFGGVLARVGIGKQTKKFDVLGELAIPVLIGLPDNAVAPPPRGALGLGGNYAAANKGQDAGFFPKQVYARFKFGSTPANASSLRLGRFDWFDGSEVAPKNPTLAALKRDRINQRLVGNFGFSHVTRSFDGGQFQANAAGGVFNVSLMRPTEGVFQLDGLGEVNGVNLGYASYTRPGANSEARLVVMHYRDNRPANQALKTDNRPAALRAADSQDIAVTTVAAHYIKTFGQFDALAWGALQTGDWGTQSHRANAVSLEGGYQPKSSKLKPWFRVGYYRGSGDDNPLDNRHGTFFTNVTTPRIYARTPIYNQMNNEDIFASLILRPTPKLSIRTDARRINLANRADLWYAGGGPFSDAGSGYAGRPSGGHKDLGNLLDISADYNLNPAQSLGLYYGHFSGGDVIGNIYPGKSLNYGYVEFTQKF